MNITPERISTAHVAPELRREFWNRVVTRTGDRVKVDFLDDNIEASMTVWRLSELMLCRLCSSASLVDAAPTRSTRSAVEPMIRLHLQELGSVSNLEENNGAVLNPGEWVLSTNLRPSKITFSTANSILMLLVPAKLLARRMPDLDRLNGPPLDYAAASSMALNGFLRTLAQVLEQGANNRWGEGMAEILLDMIALSATERTPGRRGCTNNITMQHRVQHLIDERIAAPNLHTGTLANELGVTARYLQKIFARLGTTPSAYILAKRLDLAALRLCETDSATSITTIALDLGFNDPSYFSRTFQAKFGITPRQYRGLKNGSIDLFDIK